MPPFRYDAYRNPYGPSIAEALAQQGSIEAAGAVRAGNLQADAAERRGAIQAQMWGGVGNALAAIPQQMRQNKELALREEQQRRQAEIQGMQLDEARRAQKTRQVLEQELGNPQNYHPDGRLNEALVLPRLQQQDFGAYQQVQSMAAKRQADALTQAKALSGLAVDEATLAEKAGKRAADSQEHLGKAAFTAGQELQPDQPLQGRDYAAQIVGRQVAAGTVSQADANRFYLALAQAKPDEVGAILQAATAPDLRAKIQKEQAEALRARADAEKTQREALEGKPLTGEERIANLMGREAAGETLNATDKAALEGWRLKEGSKPFTVKTVENGRPVERVMTTAQAMKQGLFVSPPTAAERTGSGSSENVKIVVQGMKKGTLPPLLPGRATQEFIDLQAEAERQGFDLAGAASDWNATQKHLATANGAQQTRLRQAVNALPEMLDKVDALAQKWQGGPFPLLNRANLAAAKGGAYGKEAATIANQLDAQIADVVADLGNVYMGGNSPTDHALSLAGKSLSGDWDRDVLLSMVKLAKENVTIRQNSIRNTGVAGASDENPYDRTPRVDQGPPAVGTVKMQAPNGQTQMVRPDEVAHYRALGAVVVK